MIRIAASLSFSALLACQTPAQTPSRAEAAFEAQPASTVDSPEQIDDFAQSQITAQAKLAHNGPAVIAEQGGKKITSWKSKLQDLRVTSVGLEDLKLDWNRAAKIVLVSPEVDMGCSLQNPFGVTLQNEEISIAGVEIAGGDPLDSIEGESPEDLKNDSVECREAMSSFLSEKLVVLAYSVPSVSKGAIKSYTVKLDLTH